MKFCLENMQRDNLGDQDADESDTLKIILGKHVCYMLKKAEWTGSV
jgi:hypothetical protein